MVRDDSQLCIQSSLPDVTDIFYVSRPTWRRLEHKGGLPCLYRMARQFLGTPASSAEAERLFSTAGRIHDDLSNSMSEDALSVRLEAGYNCR